MDDLVGVDEVEALKHLLHHLLDLLQGELDIEIAEEASQVVLAEVEHKVEGGLVSIVCSADLDQIHNVVVVQQLKNPYLPRNSLHHFQTNEFLLQYSCFRFNALVSTLLQD